MILEAILGQVIGFGAAAIDSAIDYFKVKEQNRHELEMAKTGHEHRVKEYDQSAGDKEHERVLDHDAKTNDWLRSSVRPVITYGLFAFAMALSFGIVSGLMGGFDASAKMEIIAYIFAMTNTAIGFWFGNRNRDKMIKLMENKNV